jgi:hypothetical protein
MTGAEGIGGGAAAYYASQAQSIFSALPIGSLSGGEGAPSTSSADSGPAASTNLSPFAQLLSGLQQLQSQDPTRFSQVTSQISSQLQSAAQQASGLQSTGLGNLADEFQNASTTGNLSPLETQPHGHHGHHGGGGGTYDANGQSTGNGNSGLQQTLQQLFTQFTSEVNSALGQQQVAGTSGGS